MTKRHFEDFARRIKAERDNVISAAQWKEYPDGCATRIASEADKLRTFDETAYAAALISAVATTYNPRFDRARFFRACGITS